jgi:hypothetical protein
MERRVTSAQVVLARFREQTTSGIGIHAPQWRSALLTEIVVTLGEIGRAATQKGVDGVLVHEATAMLSLQTGSASALLGRSTAAI